MFGNLLNQAFNLIPQQSFWLARWSGKTLNEQGIFVDEYEAPQAYMGSIQSVEQSVYEKLGLDFEKTYRQVYASVEMRGLSEQEGPDRLIFEGKNWTVVKNIPWFSQDGWCGVFVVWDGTYAK